ncbi:MAG: hypothetical protein ACTSSE_05955 [Candidatus Thorarchaeota archaeon]
MTDLSVAVVQLGGCDRCAWHMLDVSSWSNTELIHHSLLHDNKHLDSISQVDLLILTGYADGQKRELLSTLAGKAKKIVTYGTCPHSGGIFGLMNQKGADVIGIPSAIEVDLAIQGCPPNVDSLRVALIHNKQVNVEPLCKSCNRTMTDGNIDEIKRVPDFDESSVCFNNQGLPCNGVVSAECPQRCIDFQTPCRGCVEGVELPVASMIGYFGAVAAKVEVDTMATSWTTDKLGDQPDAITRGLVDVVGTFSRFQLATTCTHVGLIPSNGDMFSDIMVGRTIEEAPQIAATIYGSSGISVALNLIEGFEKAVSFTPNSEITDLRKQLRATQKRWSELQTSPSAEASKELMQSIRNLAGNEVLSNVYFYGFKTPIESTQYSFDQYRTTNFEPGEVSSFSEDEFSSVKFVTDKSGIIREWFCELRIA